jgi:hypothetical protein
MKRQRRDALPAVTFQALCWNPTRFLGLKGELNSDPEGGTFTLQDSTRGIARLLLKIPLPSFPFLSSAPRIIFGLSREFP